MKLALPGLLLWLLCSLAATPAWSAELSIFAASSLTESLREIARQFQQLNPQQQVRLNFAGSQALATQIEQGAPADLFVSANRKVMQRLERQGLVGEPRPLVNNRLVLVAHEDLQPALTSLHDLGRQGLLLAVGSRQVPVGYYTRKMLTNLEADPAFGPALVRSIERNIASEEGRVKAIVAKLLLGEADAGVVYRSDVSGDRSGRLRAVDIPPAHSPQVVYPLARVKDGNPQVEMFTNFLFSDRARQVFAAAGFLTRENP